MRFTQLASCVALALAITTTGQAMADSKPAPSVEELWRIIQAQQKQIEALTKSAKQTEEKVEAAGELAEQSLAKASSSGKLLGDKTTIGGYGEVHYNNLENGDGSDFKEIDLHRFVINIDHEFSDRVRFFSELEVEHGGVQASGSTLDGEVEVEQAFVEFDITDNYAARGGVFIVPVGIINETHEPTTFYGVERNPIENIIVPATWVTAGGGVSGRYENGISFNFDVHSGLEIPTSGGSAFRIRSGRQKVSNAVANDLAATGRLKYTGIPGLELAASLNYQTDASQQSGDGLDEGLLFETHAIWNRGAFTAKALFAQWNFDGDAIEAADGDEQDGFYLEGSYKFAPAFGVFARFDDVDGVRVQDEFEQFNVGFNYYPHEDVVLKFDYIDRENDTDSDRDLDGFNVGIGYQF